MATKELGATLFDVRQPRKRSLKSVADQAEISPAYLQKLERGDVKSPSPHVLLALGEGGAGLERGVLVVRLCLAGDRLGVLQRRRRPSRRDGA